MRRRTLKKRGKFVGRSFGKQKCIYVHKEETKPKDTSKREEEKVYVVKG